jgi:uncharacterized protein YdbL (DUF1318 family)
MPTPVVRAYLARVEDVNARERSIVAKINTAAVDRYRTVIDPRGISLTNYRSNPVVLWEHGRDFARGAMPVGRNDWVRPAIGPDGPELIAKTLFHSGKKADEFTDRLFECYKDGDMRAFSVNVIPDESRTSPPTQDEKRERPELEDCMMCYRGSELAEYSLVAVGGNAQALTLDEARSIMKCVGRGLTLPAELVKRAQDVVDPQEDPEEGERTIVEQEGKWLVYSAKGKKVGEYDSADEAEKCKMAGPKGKGGKGGKDDEKKTDDDPCRNLPPLTGRSLADSEAAFLGQIRSLFNTSEIVDDLKARADLRRGIV